MASYDIFSSFYDLFTDTVDYQARAAYFHKILSSNLEGQVLLLDLACGTGSLSVELAKLGYEVVGVDASIEMLMQAQQKAAIEEQQILFLNQTMEELDLYGTIRACVCALDSLNHLPSEAALEQAIARVSLFMEEDGIFIFDMNTPYKHKNVLSDNCFVFEKDKVFCVWQNETEDLKTDITLDFFVQEGTNKYKRYSEQFTERAYQLCDIERILTQNKFQLLHLYGEDSFTPAQETAERWIFVARKEK